MTSNSTERRVAVTGLGVVSSLGQDIDTFWNSLIAGRCGIGTITAFDASKFDCRIAAEVKGFDPTPAFPSPKEVRRTDRFAQFGVYAGWQALRDSGLDLESVNLDEVGVFIGSGIGGLETVHERAGLDLIGIGKRSPASARFWSRAIACAARAEPGRRTPRTEHRAAGPAPPATPASTCDRPW